MPEDTQPLQSPAPFLPRSTAIALFVLVVILGAASFGASELMKGRGVHLSQAAAANTAVNPFDSIEVEAKGAIVVDLATGETLYEKNAEAQLPLASITKVPLTLVVEEVLSPDVMVTMPKNISSALGALLLLGGENWHVRDIIDATLVSSSNDGAEVLAALVNDRVRKQYPIAPEENAALWRMNMLARELGLSQTYFLNVSGLDVSETLAGSYGSARDMATLFAYAYSHNASAFSETAHDTITLHAPSSGRQVVVENTNVVEGSIPGLIMGKTGFTDLAGGNLAIVFDAGLAHPIVAVVLGSSIDGRFTDMQKLVETAKEAIARE